MTRQALRKFFREQEWCGCSQPEEANAFLLEVLEAHPLFNLSNARRTEIFKTDGIEQFVLRAIDRMGLNEHGGSIGGSWLTDKGKDVRDALRAEAGDGFVILNDNCCMHGYSVDRDEGICVECQ